MMDGGGLPKGRDGERQGLDLLNVTSGHKNLFICPPKNQRGFIFTVCFTTRCRQIPHAGAEASTYARAHYYLQVNECLWKTAASVAARRREFRPNRPADGPAESYLLFMRTSYDGAVH